MYRLARILEQPPALFLVVLGVLRGRCARCRRSSPKCDAAKDDRATLVADRCCMPPLKAAAPLSAADLARTFAELQRIADGTGLEQLALPTPCESWSVRDVLNHIIVSRLLILASLTGGTACDPTADHVGSDHREALRRSGEAVMRAFDEPGVLGRSFDTPCGEQTGAALAAVSVKEALVHGWDITRATGQPCILDAELCERALADYRASLGADRSNTPFGPEQPVDSRASAADRLAAFVGRTVPLQ